MEESPSEEVTPVPGHVSIDNSRDSGGTMLSPVTLDLTSFPVKKLVFQDEHSGDDGSSSVSTQMQEALHEAMQFIDEKRLEIEECLSGRRYDESEEDEDSTHADTTEDTEVVDLWRLRQLALSRGGLLDVSIRKRAWIKLIDASESILLNQTKLESLNVEHEMKRDVAKISNHELNLIKEDIGNCIWEIGEEIRIGTMVANEISGQSVDTDNTSFTSFESTTCQPQSPTPQCRPEPIIEDKESCASPSSYKVARRLKTARAERKKKEEERSLLLNIITSVLRTYPSEVKDLGMERLFYYPGMHNVAALLLISLHSPSLTSLTLKRLSTYHMKDSVSPSFDDIQAITRCILYPVLEHFDKELYFELNESGVYDPCSFALRWILCWFSSDINDYRIVARLFDAFLVSHYTFPIYVAAAMITSASNRSRIKGAIANEDAEHLAEILFSVPSTVVTTCQSRLEVESNIEEIIETATNYIHLFPPDEALELAKRSSNDVISSSVLVASKARYRPLWTYQSMAYSDMNIIKESRLIRNLTPRDYTSRQRKRREILNKLENKRCNLNRENMAISNACASSLLKDYLKEETVQSTKTNVTQTSRRGIKRLILFVVFTLVGIVYNTQYIEKQVVVKEERHLETMQDADEIILEVSEKVKIEQRLSMQDADEIILEVSEKVKIEQRLSRAFLSAKEYVVKIDPDLFFILS